MRKINIISACNIKENYFREAEREYFKRLSGEFAIANFEIKEERLPENYSERDIKICLEKECLKIAEILNKFGKNNYNIILDANGIKLNSLKFSELLYCDKLINSQNINFIIGSSNGLCDNIKNSGDFKLSFSDMIFPHGLIRVMLAEQIYRAFMIFNKRMYHK